jgi:hypothetical protein
LPAFTRLEKQLINRVVVLLLPLLLLHLHPQVILGSSVEEA